MKKVLLAVFGLALICGLSTSSFAANATQTFPITVHILADAVDLQGTGTGPTSDTVDFGGVGPTPNYQLSNQLQGQPRSTVKQMGYANINLKVSATITGGWELTSGTYPNPGLNRCKLEGIFTAPLMPGETSPSNPDFEHALNGTDDFTNDCVITGTEKIASATTFARPNELNQFLGSGVNSALNTRNLRYKLTGPDAASNPAVQTINVVIAADVL